MLKFKFLLFLFLSVNSGIIAQRKTNISVDRIILNIPDSLTYSSNHIANYIDSNFTTDENKLRAVFVWIAHNIDYDVNNICNLQGTNGNIDETLKIIHLLINCINQLWQHGLHSTNKKSF